MIDRIKEFWKKHEHTVILIIGFALVALLSFQSGVLNGQKIKQNPIIIEKPVESLVVNKSGDQKSLESQNLPSEEKGGTISSTDQTKAMSAGRQDCAFAGSKNSNKYHLPTCRYAKNISPKNLVCFLDENDAKSKGYLPDKNCIK